MPRTFPHIVVEGEPYARGRQHGVQASDPIGRAVGYYAGRAERIGLTWAQARAFARGFVPAIERHLPDALAEMAGIADGAGAALDDVLVLNARYELIRLAPRHRPDECTAAFQGRWLAQNWDFDPAVLATTLVLEVRGDPDAIVLTEAGQLGRMGMNGAGLGVVVNGLSSPEDRPGEGLPVSLFRRALLACRDLDEGIARLRALPRGASNHLLVAEAGRACGIELLPDRELLLAPTDGRLVHANHFDHPEAAGPADPGSRGRQDRLTELLARGTDLREALSDHAGGICRHPVTRPSATLATVILDLADRTFTVGAGNPCEATFVRTHVGERPASTSAMTRSPHRQSPMRTNGAQ